MHLQAEVTGIFDRPGDASRLLYVPLDRSLTSRVSRFYSVDYEGDTAALTAFLERVLADPVSHRLHTGGAPAFSGWSFCLSYSLKPGALDLEKETILRHHREDPDAGFSIRGLRIHHRVYIFDPGGRPDTVQLADRFVRDIVNPAIHTWQVTTPEPAAA